MSQPTPYERLYNLVQYATDNPASPYNPAQHDAEFDAVEENLDGLNTNLALLQRDDGRLANASVHPNALDSATRLLIASWNIRGNWTAFVDYAVKDFVVRNSLGYVAMVAHTSNDFTIDLAAGRWLQVDVNMAAFASPLDGLGDALVAVKLTGTGSVARTQHDVNEEINSVQGYGASTSATAGANTIAFNAALAAHSVVFVPGDPGDVYDLNALTALTTSHILYGNATLRFNTTSDCITVSQASSIQSKHVKIVDLTFANITNVPSSFIKNDGFLNAVFENLKFDGVAATYCIDNIKGYGTTVRKCTFTDVTGSAARLRDDGGVTKYSYAFEFQDCDLTRISANGVDVEGTGALKFTNTVFETIVGDAVKTNSNGGSSSIQGWNVTFDTCYFESNTGYDINLVTDGSTYWGEALLLSCKFAGSPKIALGSFSVLTAINSRAVSGGDPVVVSGSANATATLINSTLFTQSGSFNWINLVSGTSGNTSYIGTRGLLALSPVRTAGYKLVFGDPDTAGNNFLGVRQETDATNLISLQGVRNGTGAQAIPLNPLGGNVLVGSATDTGLDTLQVTGSAIVTTRFTGKKVAVAQAATMTCNASLGNSFLLTFTNTSIFTVGNPSNAKTDQRIKLTLKNTAGGAMGAATWDTLFKMSAWTNPANGNSRSIEFEYDGTNWIQISQTGVDVPN